MKVQDFDYEMLDKLPVVLKERTAKVEGKKVKTSVPFINEIIAFDIEATNLKDIEQAVMYIWAIQVGDDVTIYGRTWDEFLYFITHAKAAIKEKHLVIYVHNLGYEFQFLKGIYSFTDEDVFATDTHKVLRCTMYSTIELRCSYHLTNLSLDAFTKQMGVQNKKLSGEKFDYSKQRFPWTELSDYEMQYMTNDVKGLVQALKKKFENTHDDIVTIPLTSTGFVRRDVKKAMEQYNQWNIRTIFPSRTVYKLLREAYRGGNTQANRYFAEQIVENVSSYDMVSSYPNVLLTEFYPMSKFKADPVWTKEHIWRLIKNKKAIVARFGFGNIRLKNPNCPCPYISRDKCRGLNVKDKKNVKIWNGRVLKADFLETTLTDIDFKIIDSMYVWDSFTVSDLYVANYGPLPKPLKDTILHYYTEKSRLKGTEKDDPDYVYYCMLKALLNACYGMMVEDPCKSTVEFDGDDFTKEPIESIEKRLNQLKYNAVLVYQWGVWCSAHARKNLQDGIDLVGDDFVYCDTDSVKYVGEHDFKRLNSIATRKAKNAKAFASDQWGEVHYIGVWEEEADDYPKPNRFATLGAKKYVVEVPDKDSKTGVSLHTTISGVKKGGGKELGEIENFKEGFTFKKYGKPVTIYNNDVDMTIEKEGHELHISDNLFIREGTYTIGITQENRDLLNGLIRICYSDYDIEGLYCHAANEDDEDD